MSEEQGSRGVRGAPGQGRADGAPLRILVVVAEPDERGCSDHLQTIVHALDRRPDVEVAVWFLRVIDVPSWWGDARDVDSLRTSPVGRLTRLAGPRVALGLQGLRLRRWMAQVDPDVVVLDDGLGERLLPSTRCDPVIVVRRNPEGPVRGHMEAAPRADGDLVLWSALDPDEAPGGEHWLRAPPFLAPARSFAVDAPEGSRPRIRPHVRPIAERAAEARAELRAATGLDPDVPLVVGWGDDGWLDGPDLFVRALWFLEDRHGIEAHGAWIGLDDAREWRERLGVEAERCGVADRFHLLGAQPQGLEWGADAAFLPSRVPADPEVLIDCGAAGLDVVAFAPTMVDAPWIHEVPVLDVEGAAAAIAVALARDPGDTQREMDVDLWTEDLVDRLRRARRP